MFLLKDVIEQLEFAEASLISLVSRDGVLLPEKYNRVIRFLNTAMSDLYTRFDMVQGSCVVKTTEGKHSYTIDASNALTANPLGFIVDDMEFPFTDTVLEITSVSTMNNHPLLFNTMDRSSRPFDLINDKSYSLDACMRSFNSPKHGVLRTPLGLRDSLLKLTYKAGHKPFASIPVADLETFDTESMVIDLPYPFLMPIVFYICSRANNGRGSERIGQGIANEGSTFFSKYLAECKLLKETMSQTTQTTTPVDNFSRRGFV